MGTFKLFNTNSLAANQSAIYMIYSNKYRSDKMINQRDVFIHERNSDKSNNIRYTD